MAFLSGFVPFIDGLVPGRVTFRVSGCLTTYMNFMKNKMFEAERIFLRSCLETAPHGGSLRPFAVRHTLPAPKPAPLHLLKQKLLHAELATTGEPRALQQLCGAANAAAELVWNTDCPLLLFPCLFEELAAAIPRPAPRRYADEPDAGLLEATEPAEPRTRPVYAESRRLQPILNLQSAPATLTLSPA